MPSQFLVAALRASVDFGQVGRSGKQQGGYTLDKHNATAVRVSRLA